MNHEKKLIVFDLGETLIQYTGIPLDWNSHYINAIENALSKINLHADSIQIEKAITILTYYNTRINPREKEVEEGEIIKLVAGVLKVPFNEFELEFFNYFQRRCVIESTAIQTLT